MEINYTGKQRMLNAYRGISSGRAPVAPEFWYYIPARVLGVDMIQFQREIPHWQALKTTFEHYKTEGWGIAGAGSVNESISGSYNYYKLDNGRYRADGTTVYKGHEFNSSVIFDKVEPSWSVRFPADEDRKIIPFLDMQLDESIRYFFDDATRAYESVGESYLLEMSFASTFFDFVAWGTGFERAIEFFCTADEQLLDRYQKRYIESRIRFIDEAVASTPFESYFIGCGYSCNSLISPALWRRWDKPVITEMGKRLHKYGKLVHLHYHGKVIETTGDLSGMEIDCVCPFERPIGGDVSGREGLIEVRRLLMDKVTFNGNVQTVETLIRGTPEDVRAEVREIKEVFSGSARLIIGTGDQVGLETPDENIFAMVDEAMR